MLINIYFCYGPRIIHYLGTFELGAGLRNIQTLRDCGATLVWAEDHEG